MINQSLYMAPGSQTEQAQQGMRGPLHRSGAAYANAVGLRTRQQGVKSALQSGKVCAGHDGQGRLTIVRP